MRKPSASNASEIIMQRTIVEQSGNQGLWKFSANFLASRNRLVLNGQTHVAPPFLPSLPSHIPFHAIPTPPVVYPLGCSFRFRYWNRGSRCRFSFRLTSPCLCGSSIPLMACQTVGIWFLQFSHELNQKIKLDYTAQIVKFLIRSGAHLPGEAVAPVMVVNLCATGSQWKEKICLLHRRRCCHSDSLIFASLHIGPCVCLSVR